MGVRTALESQRGSKIMDDVAMRRGSPRGPPQPDQQETKEGRVTQDVFLTVTYRLSHFSAFFTYYDALAADTSLAREEGMYRAIY